MLNMHFFVVHLTFFWSSKFTPVLKIDDVKILCVIMIRAERWGGSRRSWPAAVQRGR
jgi:hypothetical protein